jgi:hypothetical protein
MQSCFPLSFRSLNYKVLLFEFKKQQNMKKEKILIHAAAFLVTAGTVLAFTTAHKFRTNKVHIQTNGGGCAPSRKHCKRRNVLSNQC